MSRADDRGDQPRAMIHRRILDVAATRPEASSVALAEEVSGASPSLVERVLEEYGDPAVDGGSESDPDSDSLAPTDASDTEDAAETSEKPQTDPQQSMATKETERQGDGTSERSIEDVSLSDKQRRTLREVFERPTASQGEIAESLNVTRATVSRRLNSIPGFEWENRGAVAQSVFGDEQSDGSAQTSSGTPETEEGDTGGRDESTSGDPDAAKPTAESGDETTGRNAPAGRDGPTDTEDEDDTDSASREVGDDRETRGAALEAADVAGPNDATEEAVATFSLSPELAHKVLRACLSSDQITEEEEITLVTSLVRD